MVDVVARLGGQAERAHEEHDGEQNVLHVETLGSRCILGSDAASVHSEAAITVWSPT